MKKRFLIVSGIILMLFSFSQAEDDRGEVEASGDLFMVEGVPLGGSFADIVDYKSQLWAYQSSDLFLKTDWNKIEFYKIYQESRLPSPLEDGAYSQFIAVTPKMMTRSEQVYVEQGKINQANFFNEFSSFGYVVDELEKQFGDQALRHDYDRGTTIFCLKDNPILRDVRVFRMEITGVHRGYYTHSNQRVADVCQDLLAQEESLKSSER